MPRVNAPKAMRPADVPDPADANARFDAACAWAAGLRGETTWQFLRRSTWERAAETRAFYNDLLAALPASSRQPLLDALAAGRTQSALLEMLVGRFLQLRGTLKLEHEPGYQRRKVDWEATYPDGTIHVEAFMPVYNAGSGETAWYSAPPRKAPSAGSSRA